MPTIRESILCLDDVEKTIRECREGLARAEQLFIGNGTATPVICSMIAEEASKGPASPTKRRGRPRKAGVPSATRERKAWKPGSPGRVPRWYLEQQAAANKPIFPAPETVKA